jgi:hypothetical protein
VPEEGALGQPGASGDLSGRGLVEPPRREQSQSGFLQSAATVRLPSTHAAILTLTVTDIVARVMTVTDINVLLEVPS